MVTLLLNTHYPNINILMPSSSAQRDDLKEYPLADIGKGEDCFLLSHFTISIIHSFKHSFFSRRSSCSTFLSLSHKTKMSYLMPILSHILSHTCEYHLGQLIRWTASQSKRKENENENLRCIDFFLFVLSTTLLSFRPLSIATATVLIIWQLLK